MVALNFHLLSTSFYYTFMQILILSDWDAVDVLMFVEEFGLDALKLAEIIIYVLIVICAYTATQDTARQARQKVNDKWITHVNNN